MTSKVQYIVDSFNDHIKASQSRFKRSYIGASAVGHECARYLQYSFRHCIESDFDALSLKRFEDGHYSEAVYIKRIKDAGFSLQHEENGKQYGFSALGGWFRGHRDGMFHSLPDIGPAIWEHKSTAKWETLKKLVEKDESTALEKWNTIYYAQAQLYMGYEDVNYHVLTAASEGSRKESICLTEFNEKNFKEIESKALNIITSDRLLPRIGSNQTFWQCKWCDGKDVCWNKVIPKPSCRNCAAIEFKTDGNNKAVCQRWSGVKDGVNVVPSVVEGDIKSLELYKPCHMYMIGILSDDEPQVISSEKERDGINFIESIGLQYDKDGVKFINGDMEGAVSSMEIYQNQEGRPWESSINMLKNKFNGKFENWKVKDERN